ncbi:MAG: hypothetical protein ACRCZN_04950 [Lactococcus lactis]
MNKKIKNSTITFAVALALFPIAFTTTEAAVNADSKPVISQAAANVSNLQIPVKHTVEVKGDDTIVTISDSDMYSYLGSQGINVGRLGMLRSNGVTKIVWHGAVTRGNVDLYFSKNWLNTMTAIGVGAIAGAVGALLPGAGWGAAVGAISAAISSQSFSNGQIFLIRTFRFSGMVRQ